MPITTTATELQRNYKNVTKKAKRSKKPLIVLSNNKPEGVFMDYDTFKNKYSDTPTLKKRTQKSNLTGADAVFGTWTKEETDRFNKIIEEEFERIDPEDWR